MACETRLMENGMPPEPNVRIVSLISFLCYQYITPKHALLCLHPVKLFLNFGRSAAHKPYNYVAALMLYGTQGSVRGLNRWEYKWLA